LGIPHPPRDSRFPTAATTNFRLHFRCLDNPRYGYILKWLDWDGAQNPLCRAEIGVVP